MQDRMLEACMPGDENQRKQEVRQGRGDKAAGQRTGRCECARCFGTKRDANGSFFDGGGGLNGLVGEDCVEITFGGFGGTLAIPSLTDGGSSGISQGGRSPKADRLEAAGGEQAGVVVREEDDVAAVLDGGAETVEAERGTGGRIRRCTVTVTLVDVEFGAGGRIGSLGLARTLAVLPAGGTTLDVYKVFCIFEASPRALSNSVLGCVGIPPGFQPSHERRNSRTCKER